MRFAGPVLLTLAAATLVLGRERSWLGAMRSQAGRAPRGVLSRLPTGVRPAVLAGVTRMHGFRTRRERAAALTDLPLALDLLGCALRAGQPPSTAAAAVAAAVRGPVADALLSVARAADLGAPPDIALQPLGRLTNIAAVARAAARTAESGTRLADELARIAGDQRVRRAAAAQARVRRAGVLVVLPLGLCFLPAFALIGVVPIVIGIAGSLLR